jgi:HSP90 family molecular chaperone
MPQSSRQISFQVDIAGVIEILGSALYSRPDTAIRELIQNAHDSILAAATAISGTRVASTSSGSRAQHADVPR